MGFFLPHDTLHHLKEYKYQSEDRSLMTKYVLKPFWIKFAMIFPTWMAPNMVTLCGLFFILINLITVFIYDPLLQSEQPRWCYFSYAVGMFLYQTFDACDGLHARRTGQSGPLGELFDHCVDAVNTTLSVIIFASVTGIGWSWYLVLAQFATLMNFYLSTWEEYHTHKLFLSEFSGPVEGILLIIGMFITTGFFGPEIWKHEVFYYNDKPVTTTELAILTGGVGLYFNIDSARANVAKYYENGTNGAYKGLLPFFVYYSTVVGWLWYNTAVFNCLAPFVLTIGLTTAFMVGRIIVAHLTKQHFPMMTPSMVIPGVQLVLFIIAQTQGYDPTEGLIWGGFGLATGLHGMFIVEIIYEITGYLDIYALSIKHPKTE